MTDLFERISRLSPQRLALLVMDLQSKLDTAQRARQEPIAIVGMSCRTPGGVDSPEAFWQLLVNGVDAITEVPAARWTLDIPEFLGRRATGDLRGYWGGFVDGIDQFDAQFFGIVPREAVRMDPQQRMLLEVAWEALERAGIAPDRLTGTQTGVYIGQNSADYGQVLLSTGLNAYDLHSLMGSMPCITAGRISYLLGLQGPNLALDTGCSSSLVALHLAVQSLRSGECNLALAGGVNAILTPSYSVAASRAEVLAPDGRCKTFDAAADGYVRSDGCGVVVLKRLSDAQADGDTILAIVRGTAVNQDGRSNGLTAPNGPSQTEVIRAALASGGVDPHDIAYVEAHGTGTPLGDPIEAQALGAALGEGRPADQPLWIGSVKTNIGHLEAAAGVAGLIKLVLSLQHGKIPPSLNFTKPSPHIPWDTLPLQVPTSVQPWDSADRPRIGGVSSFGLSGTNAHAVVEAAPSSAPTSNERERPLHLLPLSAKTETALTEMAARYRAHLSDQPAATADITYTAGVGRSQFPHRLAVIGGSVGELDAGLATYLRGSTSPNVLRSRSIEPQTPKVAFLFTGLGSQFVGMGRQLYETQPTFRAALEQCQELLRPRLEQPLLSVLYPEAGVTSRLEDRAYGLPVVFAFEYALAQLWRSWGIEPSYVLGHSLGEYVAACVAGVFSLEDGLRLSAERARLVSMLLSAGQMVSVLAPEAQIAAIIADFPEDVSIAAINGPESVVVAGQSAGMQTVLDRFADAGLSVRTLAIPFAAHSPTLEPMLDPFEQFAASIRYASPRLDLVSGRTGRLAGENELTNATYWRRHLREPVRFADAVETLYAQGCRHFVEIGSAPVLLGLAQQSILDPDTVWLPSLDPKRPDWDRLLESLGTLFTRGFDVDWAGFDRDYNRRKVVLPTYPFQRERVWIDVPAETPRTTVRAHDVGLHPLLGQRLRSPLVKDHQFEVALGAERPAFLSDHRIFGRASLPAAGFIEAGLAAAAQVYGAGPFEIEQFAFQKPLFLPDQHERTVQVVLTPSDANRSDVRVYSSGDQDETWHLNASGTVRRVPSQAIEASLPSLPLDAIQARCSTEVLAEDVYARFAADGIEFGPRFRGLTRLWKSAGEALGQIEAPSELGGDLGSYFVHPALLDACFHVLEAALPDDRPPLTYLTIGLDRVRVLGAPSNRLWSHARLWPDSPADSQSFVCDLAIYDDQLRLVTQLEGVLLQGASREALLQGDRLSLSDSLYEVQWRSQLGPVTGDQTPAADGEWLIFSDDDGVGNHLAAAIAAQGGRSTLVVPGQSYGRVSSNAWTVDPASEHDVELLLDDVYGRNSQPLRIVHLWGLRADGASELHSDALDDAATLTVGSVLHLTKALASRSVGNASRLWCVTQNVQPISTTGTLEVAQAPLWGLGRVIAIEQPDIWGGLIDLGSAVDATEQAADLLAEMLHAGEDQVALRGTARYVARLVPTSAPAERSVKIQRDGAYLIVGGLGGIGLAVARQLAEQGAGHLVLQGRSGLPNRETWENIPADSPIGGQIAAVREIEALGTRVSAVAADISNYARMSEVIGLFGTELPALRGVIHSAAALDDSVLTQSTWPRFRQAMRAKIDGAWILHELTRQTPLDFFVLFSSVASLIASPGLGNYSASNAFLDALAQYRRQGGLPGLTVNWGVWEGVGITAMADVGERVAERMSSGGLNLIPVRDGVAIFQRLLASDAAQVMVSPVQWPTFLQQFPPESAPPFYAEIARPTPRRDVIPESVSHATLGDRARASAADDREQLLAIGLREILAEVAELGPPEELAFDMPLQQFGVDSLVAVQLRNRITSEVGLTVPISSLIGGSSLAELAVILRDRLEPISSVQTEHVTEVAPTKEPTDWSSHVAELSEEELDLLLLEMLASEKGDS